MNRAKLGFLRPEAGFSDVKTKLKWHLGLVGLTKLDSFKKRKKIFNVETNCLFSSSLAQVPLKFCLGNEKHALKPKVSRANILAQ